jgi:thioesterase domain-containing protein
LFKAPTVEKLADVLRQEEPAKLWSSVVPLQTAGNRIPLFIISGLGGNVVRFRDLAVHLGSNQPVYALQPPGLDGKRPFITSLEEMASHYIQEIRKIQPAGPYCLAGYSFGGLVTFEMARQLDESGAKVGLLALLDAPEWRYLKSSLKTKTLDKAVDRFKYRLRTLLFGPDRLGIVRARARRRISQIIFSFYKAIRRPIPQAYGTIEDINWFAATSYAAKPFRGRLTLLRTPPSGDISQDYLLGWGGLALDGVEVHDVPGDHEDMMKEPNVSVLAERLASCLHGVQTLGQIANEKSPPVLAADGRTAARAAANGHGRDTFLTSLNQVSNDSAIV